LKSRIQFTLCCFVLFMVACARTPSPQEFYAKAQSYREQGNLKSAIISLKNALQAKPDYLEARVLLGEIYLISNNGISAEKEFTQALRLSADAPLLQIDMIKALRLQNKFKEIIAREANLSAMTPQQKVDWWRIRADAYLEMNSPQHAAKELEQANQLQLPSKELTLSNIKLQNAQHDSQSVANNLSNLLKNYPDFAEAWYFSARLKRAQKDLAGAQQDLKKVAQLTDAQILSRTGYLANIELIELQLRAHEYDAAREILKKLQQRSRAGNPVLNYFAAFLAYQDKQYDQARTLLQELVQALPDFMPAYLLLGATQFNLHEYESANVSVEKYLNAVAQDNGARQLLAEIQLNQNRPVEALESLSALPDSAEKDDRFLNILARATLLSGDAGSATRTLHDLVEAHPADLRLRTDLVRALANLGDIDEAVHQINDSGVGSKQKVISSAVLRIRQGKINIARNLLQVELAKQKDAKQKDPSLLTMAGIVELSDKQVEAAQVYFQQALDSDSQYAAAAIYLAQIAVKAKDYEKAENYLKPFVSEQQKNWLAFLTMANIAAGQHQSQQQVLQWLQRANQANPAALKPASLLIRYALLKGEKEKALRLAEATVAATKNNPKARILLSKVQLGIGAPNAAIEILRDLSGQFPKLGDAHRELAAIYIKQKNWKGAKSELQRLLLLDAKDVRARVGLIKVNLALKDIAAARSQVAALKQASKQGMHHPALVLLVSGDIESAAGNWKRAQAFYQQALQARENPQIVIKLANAYFRAKQLPQAIELLQKWHDKQSFSLISLILADYYQRAGDSAKAIKTLQEVSAREPKNAVIWNNLAWLYLAANDDKFMQAASTAYQLNPKSYQIIDTYGWMLLQTGKNKEKALAILNEADQAAPGIPSIKYHVALALHKNGRNAEAKMMLEQALSGSKAFPEKAQAEQLLRDW